MADDGIDILDLSRKDLKKIERRSGSGVISLILDNNDLSKLENLDTFCDLKYLTCQYNRLMRMFGITKLHHLENLNLSNNELVCIESLKELLYLSVLNLSNNRIKLIQHLNYCQNLTTIDLSKNFISSLVDFRPLVKLQRLNLNHNKITTLNHIASYFPNSLIAFSIASNSIQDLNEVSYITNLPYLEQFSFENNPCVVMTGSSPGFDYRPFIINWNLGLRMLDGYCCSQKESLKAEWLYSQGKGRQFTLGEHSDLVEYLSHVCPMTTSGELVPEEEEKLNRILQKQHLHREQLLQLSQSPVAQRKRSHSQDNNPSPPDMVAKVSPAKLLTPSYESHSVKTNKEERPIMESVSPHQNSNTLSSRDKLNSSIPETRRFSRSASTPRSPFTMEQLPLNKSSYQQYEERVARPIHTPSATFSDSSICSKTLPIRKVASRRAPSPSSTFAGPTSNTTPRKSRNAKSKWRDRMSQSWCSPDAENKCRKRPTSESDTEDCSTMSAFSSRIATLASPQVRKPPTAAIDYNSNKYTHNKPIDRNTHVKRTISMNSYLAHSAASPVQPDRIKVHAATKIQSVWRGYHTRTFNPMALAVKQEMRVRRMEDTILQLKDVVLRQHRELQQEKEFRRLQSEDIARLMLQVKNINRDLSQLKSLPSTPNRNFSINSCLQLAQPPLPPLAEPPNKNKEENKDRLDNKNSEPAAAVSSSTPASTLFDSGIHSPSLGNLALDVSKQIPSTLPLHSSQFQTNGLADNKVEVNGTKEMLSKESDHHLLLGEDNRATFNGSYQEQPDLSSTSEDVSSINTVLPTSAASISPASSSSPTNLARISSTEFHTKMSKMEKILQDFQNQFKDLQGMGLLLANENLEGEISE